MYLIINEDYSLKQVENIGISDLKSLQNEEYGYSNIIKFENNKFHQLNKKNEWCEIKKSDYISVNSLHD